MKKLIRPLGVVSMVAAVAMSMTTGVMADPLVITKPPQAVAAQRGVMDPAAGEDLFRGVFFGLGSVADRLGTHFTAPVNIPTADYAPQVASLVSEMRTTDPARFNRAAEDLTSGSIVRVRQGLTDAGGQLRARMDAHGVQHQEGVRPHCGAVAVCVAFVGAISWVVAQNSVVATTVAAVWAAAWKWKGVGNLTSQGTGLDDERALAVITDRLATL